MKWSWCFKKTRGQKPSTETSLRTPVPRTSKTHDGLLSETEHTPFFLFTKNINHTQHQSQDKTFTRELWKIRHPAPTGTQGVFHEGFWATTQPKQSNKIPFWVRSLFVFNTYDAFSWSGPNGAVHWESWASTPPEQPTPKITRFRPKIPCGFHKCTSLREVCKNMTPCPD